MEKYIINCVSYHIADEKLQRLSNKIACKFNSVVVNRDVIEPMIDKVSKWLANNSGLMSTISFTQTVQLYNYRIGVVMQDGTRQFLVDFYMPKCIGNIYEVQDVQEYLKEIYI